MSRLRRLDWAARAGGPGRKAALAAVVAATVMFAAGCASETPLERLQRELEPFPEYSVILQDMRPEGFYHQYRVVVGQPGGESGEVVHREQLLAWQKVGRRTYNQYQSFLGMVILSKGPDGAIDQQQHPPGYQQVGDERYGRWRDDGGGRSFWEFYGQYALLSHVIGGFNRPIYRNDWNGYRDSRSRGQTYYGPGGAYGTSGSVTRQTNPDFFRRQQARQAARTQGFGDRVRSRMLGGGRFGGK